MGSNLQIEAAQYVIPFLEFVELHKMSLDWFDSNELFV
jgi:hypothetical protein